MITAFQLPKPDLFPDAIQPALEKAGYRVVPQKYDLEAYWPGLEWNVAGVGRVEGGCRLKRMAGGTGAWVLVQPHWSVPTKELSRIERASVDSRVLTSVEFNPGRRLEECFLLIGRLGFPLVPVCGANSVADRGNTLLGDGSRPLGQVTLKDFQGGLITPPSRSRLILVSQSHPDNLLKAFASNLMTALCRLGVNVACECHSFDGVLASLKRKGTADVKRQVVVLIGVPGGKDDRRQVPSETCEAFDRMDALGSPYRIFGDAALTDRYAPGDMAPHLATLLGASAREVRLAPEFDNTWFIGLDLGHPLHLGDSVPVLTVTDPHGRLLAWWRGRQTRDETLRHETLERAGRWLREWFAHQDTLPQHVVILRDGKVNKHDALESFAASLPMPASLVEVVKRPVPLLSLEGAPAPSATWLEVVAERDGFLQMPEPKIAGHRAHPLRLRLVSGGKAHRLADLAGAVFALCHAPTLGLRIPSAPAPIYWSDGLAANGGRDFQFRGLNHVPHYDELRHAE